MPIDDEDIQPIEDEYADYVAVVVARSEEMAERYQEILADHDIPSTVGAEADAEGVREASVSRGVPVLVPEALLDDASEIIADYEDTEDFDIEEDFDDEDDEDSEFGLDEESSFVEEFDDDDDEEDFFDDEDDEDDEFGFDDEEDDLDEEEDEPF